MQNKRIGLTQEVIAMLLAGLIIIACLLPWRTIRSELWVSLTETGFDGEGGIIYSLLALICLVLIPATGQNLGTKKAIIVGFGVVFLFLNIILIADFLGMAGTRVFWVGYGHIFEVKIEVGLYLELFLSLGLIIVGGTLPSSPKPELPKPTPGYCANCGKLNEPTAIFCQQCGGAV